MKQLEADAQPVSRETAERLRLYAALLLRWNRTINLISRATEQSLHTRHFRDCLQLVPYMPHAATGGVDMGSGAGFPGLVLAIATGLPFVLIEADHRKAAFLREASTVTGAPVTVIADRVEAADIEPADVVTARALAPLSELLRLGHRLLNPTGVALFLKGEQSGRELDDARREWRMRLKLHQSATHPSGVIMEISDLAHAAS